MAGHAAFKNEWIQEFHVNGPTTAADMFVCQRYEKLWPVLRGCADKQKRKIKEATD